MQIRTDITPNTPEWLAWRRAHKCASESSCLLGKAQYWPKTPLQLYGYKAEGWENPNPSVWLEEASENGIEMEETALMLLEKETGKTFSPFPIEGDDLYAASTDGIELGSDNPAVAEVKWPRNPETSLRVKAALKGELTPPDEIQCQHILMVSEAHTLHYGVGVADEKILRVDVKPNPFLWANIRDAWDAFWPHVESRYPPDPQDQDYLYHDDENSDFARIAVLWMEAKSEADDSKASLELIRKSLLDHYDDQLSHKGFGVTLTRYWRRGNVNYDAIPELKGVDLDKHRKKGARVAKLTESKDG